LHPTHGQDQGQRKQGLCALQGGDGNSKLGDGPEVEPDNVETIRNANFDKLVGAKFGIGIYNLV
jgi:hypothetical protein